MAHTIDTFREMLDAVLRDFKAFQAAKPGWRLDMGYEVKMTDGELEPTVRLSLDDDQGQFIEHRWSGHQLQLMVAPVEAARAQLIILIEQIMKTRAGLMDAEIADGED